MGGKDIEVGCADPSDVAEESVRQRMEGLVFPANDAVRMARILRLVVDPKAFLDEGMRIEASAIAADADFLIALKLRGQVGMAQLMDERE